MGLSPFQLRKLNADWPLGRSGEIWRAETITRMTAAPIATTNMAMLAIQYFFPIARYHLLPRAQRTPSGEGFRLQWCF